MSLEQSDHKKHFLARLAALEGERKSWEPHWRELSAVLLPRRARFLASGARTNDGKKQDANLLESVGRHAARSLASGMQSGLTSPARPWFRLSLQDADTAGADDAKAWLHVVQERMFAVFSRSNFYDCVHSLYGELAVFGTGCLLIDEDPDTVMRCRTMTVGEYCIDNNASGRVDTLYRRISMTPRQILEAWPDTCPQRIRNMAERDIATRLQILHAVEPNKDKQQGRKDGKSRPWRSVYMLLEGGNDLLEDGGCYEFPAVAPRWDVTGDDVYGTSPGMDALGDCNMLQGLRRTGMKSLHKEVDPALLVPSSLQGIALNTTPGAINYYSPLAQGQGQAVSPLYPVRANLAALEGTVADFRRQIREVFYSDLFLMISQMDRGMTATEVAERNAEKMLMLGPVLDRLRSELFQVLIVRVFGLMERQGYIPIPPESLQGQEIKIEFVSTLAQAQKAAGISAIQQVVGFVGQVAQMDQGKSLDKIDLDVAIDQVADMLGTPPKLIRSAEAVGELRAVREQQMQQMQQMQVMQQGAQIAGTGAKAIRDSGVTDMIQSAMANQGGNDAVPA